MRIPRYIISLNHTHTTVVHSVFIATPTHTILLLHYYSHQIMKDKHLALFVIALVVVDVVILSVYTLVDGLMGNLEPTKVISAENPSYTLQVSQNQ